jgi:hypothetical protein
MNRRSAKLVPLVLALLTIGVIFAPAASQAAPIDDLQAQANQLEQQISQNAEKLSALNEQINTAQGQLDEAVAAIKHADALVAAAQAKTRELKAEVARRAAAVYTQSGSTGGIEELDAQNAQDLSTKKKYSDLAAQRDDEIVHSLVQARAGHHPPVGSREPAAARSSSATPSRHRRTTRRRPGEARGAPESGEGRDRGPGEEGRGNVRPVRLRPPRLTASTSPGAVNATPRRRRARSRNTGLRLGTARQALLLRRCRPRLLRLLALTMMAWADRVSMPHARTPSGDVPRGVDERAQPGDLVFWDGHVGIYWGGGAVLHAPHSGTVVQITQIWPGVIGAARPG